MKNLQKGFSLIELLVVVAIIGILAAIGSVGYSKYIDSAKNGAGSANAAQTASALAAEDAANDLCKSKSVNGCITTLTSTKALTNVSVETTCTSSDPATPIDPTHILVDLTKYPVVTITGCGDFNASKPGSTFTAANLSNG